MFTCSICNYKTNDKYNFNRHISTNTCKTKIEKMKCEVCDKTFSNTKYKKEHLKTKKHIKNYE